MWLSCSAFFNQYNRVYGAVSFGKKHDKTGKFVRKYCPELADMPDKFVYEPWKAPEAVQKKAKCIVGKDYPAPIVDEQEAKADTLARIKRAYSFAMHGLSCHAREPKQAENTKGDDERVLSGKAFDIVRSKELDIAPTGRGSVKRKAEEDEDSKKGIKQQKLTFDTQYSKDNKHNAI